MHHFLIRRFQDFFHSSKYKIPHIQAIEYQRQRVLFYGIHLCGLMAALSMLIFSIFRRDLVSIIIDIMAIIAASGAMLLFRQTQNIKLISSISMACVSGVYLSVSITNTAGHASFLWYYTYPIVTLFLMGHKIGTVLVIGFGAIPLCIVAVVKEGFLDAFLAQELARYIAIFVAIHLLMWVSEYYREATQKKLVKESESRRREAKIKVEFLTKISHELKTPLNSVLHSLNILLELKSLSKQAKSLTQQSLQGSHTLLSLITNAINLVHVGSTNPEQANLEYEEDVTFDLRETLNDLEKDFYHKAQMKQKSFRLIIKHEIPTFVKGTPIKFRTLIMHLISKAINTSTETSLTMHVSYNHQSKQYHTLDFFIGSLTSLQQIQNNPSSPNPATKNTLIPQSNLSITDKLATSLGIKVQTIQVQSNTGIHFIMRFLMMFEVIKKKEIPYPVKDSLKNKTVLFITSDPLIRRLLHEITKPYAWTLIHKEQLLSTSRPSPHENASYDMIIHHISNQSHATKSIKHVMLHHKGMPFLHLTDVPMDPPKVPKKSRIIQKLLQGPFQHKDFFRTTNALLTEHHNSINQTPHAIKQKQENILVVDDNGINQKVILSILKSLGKPSIDVASNGIEAMQRTTKKHYHLILMDCNMPEMDGYQTAKAIRQLESQNPNADPSIIVAVTANTILGDKDKCFACGMDDYLAKPILKKNLQTILEKYLP